MIFRSLAALGLGLAIAFAATSGSHAERAVDRHQKTSSVKADKKTDKKAEQEKSESRGLFSILFKPSDGKPAAKPEPKKPVKAKAQKPEKARAAPVPEIVANGNNGELRSEPQQNKDIFTALFGGQPRLLPETRALDAALDAREARRKFKVKPEFEPQEVTFTGYKPGTIVIDTSERRLYLVESSTKARRYAIAVGRDGLQFKGTVRVGDKQEWPRWIPTLDMQKREPKHYGQYKDGMPGGPDNPLGARAIYLYQGKSDTHLRIHGTNQPQTIGTSASNGCFRMINDHVKDLYRRVRIGTEVVVL